MEFDAKANRMELILFVTWPAPDYNARQTLPQKASWEIYIGRNALLQKKAKRRMNDKWL